VEARVEAMMAAVDEDILLLSHPVTAQKKRNF
jgi:hypothetical protein